MVEWVLIITMHIMAGNGTMPDLQIQTVDGFRSFESCERAGEKIGKRLILQAGKHRKQQQVERNGGIGFPSVYADCISISK